MLAEVGQGDSEHGRIALSWSAIQDLSVVVLVVVLSAIASPQQRGPQEGLVSVGKALVFVGLPERRRDGDRGQRG